jgi:hypothetical protein
MKKLFFCMAVAAIAVTAGWNVMQSQSEEALSDVALKNVEALAGDETSSKKAYVSCSGTDIICVGTGPYNCCV